MTSRLCRSWSVLVLPLALAAAASACTGSKTQIFPGMGHSGSGETGDKAGASGATGGSGRPTEDPEGVPGYLVDPPKIQVKTDASGTTLDAPAGTVAAPGGHPDAIKTYIYAVAHTDAAALGTSSSPRVLPAKQLQTLQPAADGSFHAVVKPDAHAIVVVTVQTQASTDALTLPAAGGANPVAAFKDLASPLTFAPLAADPSTAALGLAACALGHVKDPQGPLQLVMAPGMDSGDEVCRCDQSKKLPKDHPLAGFFVGDASPCYLKPNVSADEHDVLTADFLKGQWCSRVEWECQTPPSALNSAAQDGLQVVERTGVTAAMLAAHQMCGQVEDLSGTPRPLSGVHVPADCAAIRKTITVAGKTVTACGIQDLAGGTQPQVLAACFTADCDFVWVEADLCPGDPPGTPGRVIFTKP